MLCDECGGRTFTLTGSGVCVDCARRQRGFLAGLVHGWFHRSVTLAEFMEITLMDYAGRFAFMPNVMLSSDLTTRERKRKDQIMLIKDSKTGAPLAEVPTRTARPMLVFVAVVMAMKAVFWVALAVAGVALVTGNPAMAAVFAGIAVVAKVAQFASRPIGKRIGNRLKSYITVAVASQ